MSYLDLIYEVVKDDLKLEELMDKSIEKYLDSIDRNANVKAIKITNCDDFDRLEYLKSKENYKLVMIDRYKSQNLLIAVFEITENEAPTSKDLTPCEVIEIFRE